MAMTPREKTAKWRRLNPTSYKESYRRGALKRDHGISLEEYEALLQAQGGLCAVCRQAEIMLGKHGKIKALCVDHCHTTGIIRGLLCDACNHGLGLFRDSPISLRAAAVYLESANTGLRKPMRLLPPTAITELLDELKKL